MDGLVFTCQIGRLPPTTFQVVNFTLREHLSQLFQLNLTVVSAVNNIPLGEQLNQEASLTIKRNGVVERTVNGIVAGAVQGNTDGKQTGYTFTLRPEMWRMTLNQDNRIYQHLSVPDILKKLLGEHRVKADSKFYDSAGYHAPRDYITQKRESAYDFWCRLAAEEGIIFWFEENQMFYSNSHLGMTAALPLVYNGQPNTDDTDSTVWQWQYGEYLCPDEFIHKDYNYLRPSQPMQTQANVEPSSGHSVFESYGRFQWSKEGQPFGKIRLNQLNSESKLGSAQSNCIQLRPGKIFTLSAHPSETMNDRWQVVSITHHGAQPQAAGTGGEGTTLTSDMTFIPGFDDWRPPYHYKPLADGDELATVVGPEGEEIFTNELGAIKVHFHWNRYDKPGDGSSCWVRVAQGWNGNNFGFMAVPRIGQEVIISYLNGDIDRPIVTGCNYNGRNSPPLDLPGQKTCTTFKTKTHKGEGFNELRFEDAKGSEEIYIHAQKDMNTKVLNNRTTHVDRDHEERIGQDQKLTVMRDQFEEIQRSRQTTIKLDDDESVSGSQTLWVEKNQSSTITGQQSVKIGKSQLLEVTDNQEVRVGKHIVLQSQSGQITIGNSGGQIIIDPTGAITISGTSISMTEHAAGKAGAQALFDYSGRYILTNSKNENKPLPHTLYQIKTPSGIVSGRTDAAGRTAIVQTQQADTLEFSLPEAQKKKKTKTLYHVGNNQPVDYVMEFKEESK
ncbi:MULTISPECIES: type VI secretion system Vgr family protein [Xenorhabdus]|uniref:type VI secretion system Vgr family protein n=1 Tax=Xenorhabdus TaxID=626 RepID=UPI0006494A2A|nr:MULTISPECIES: type VI secretion system tip protein TssI/VgrG [Xenorhabdus]KLU15833.1 type VI secretion protein [Xenorhabdus griffiniae]KOP34305.1 type VI secretion protein [Xenorhabdus sp. GDc328]